MTHVSDIYTVTYFLLVDIVMNATYGLQEAIEMVVACSAMAVLREREAKEEEAQSPKSSWSKWKRSGIIGAAALTGGALMALTGGINLFSASLKSSRKKKALPLSKFFLALTIRIGCASNCCWP